MVKILTVPVNIADPIERWITGSKIPWFYFTHTLGKDYNGKVDVNQNKYIIKDMPRLTHYLYPNSKSPKEDGSVINPLISWLTANHLIGYYPRRIQAHLTTPLTDANSFINIPHIDANNSKFTFLYYVNTSDGNTIFFKDGLIDLEVPPIKGTGALFPSNTPHAGQLPSININRYVINIVFSKQLSGIDVMVA